MTGIWMAFLANHVWQSTGCAAVAAALATVLRKNRAQVRYRIWFVASVKWLVPFALLVSLGARLGWPMSAHTGGLNLPLALDFASQPFSTYAVTPTTGARAVSVSMSSWIRLGLTVVWAAGCAIVLAIRWTQWQRIAAIARAADPLSDGREVDALRRAETRIGTHRPLALRASSMSLEPGAFGIVRPVLLWPRRLSQHLDDREIEAILLHEVAHVQRWDNLTASVHMVVEALVWFHPLVWWIGARLIEERERACDDAVNQILGNPRAYAEGILKVCELSVGSPLACVAGVTGSDLKQRLERIMTNDVGRAVTRRQQALLSVVGAVVIFGPVVIGAVYAPQVRDQTLDVGVSAPSFAAVTISANRSGDQKFYPTTMANGRFSVTNMPLITIIRNLYQRDGQTIGGPDWIRLDRFDIEAVADGTPSREQLLSMVRKLLAERFKLTVHKEARQMPVYALVLVKSDGTLGPRIHPSSDGCIAAGKAVRSGQPPPPPPPPPLPPPPSVAVNTGLLPPPPPPAPAASLGSLQQPGDVPCGVIASRPQGWLAGRASTMTDLARTILPGLVGRKVVDQTGLSGYFDFDVEFIPAVPGSRANPEQRSTASTAFERGQPAPFVGPLFFTALQEQLGLDFASQTGPVDVIVIDGVARPTEQ